jgi:competence protein ComEA
MEEKFKFKMAVLALLAGFTLFCTGWYLARTSAPAPYHVSVQRLPGDEDAEDAQPPEAGNARPDSLLPGEVIDINAADVYELQRLPGIGEKRAMDIIAWREEHGPFQTVEELTEVSGIGPVILENLREYVMVK